MSETPIPKREGDLKKRPNLEKADKIVYAHTWAGPGKWNGEDLVREIEQALDQKDAEHAASTRSRGKREV